MSRRLAALGIGLTIALSAPAAIASEAVAKKMAELLPPAPQGWTGMGPQVQTIEKGPAKGGMAFQIYRGPKKRSVLVRLVQNTPAQFKQAIANPGGFKFERAKVGDRDAAVQETEKGGSLIVVAGERLAMVEWSSETPRAEAVGYAEAIDFDALKEVK